MTAEPRTFKLPPVVSRDLADYIPALEEIAAEARIDPVLLLTNSDDPKIERALRKLPMSEFVIGYLHCMCAVTGTSMRPLWAALQAEFGEARPRRRRRGPGDRDLAAPRPAGRKALAAKSAEAPKPRGLLALPPGAPPPPDDLPSLRSLPHEPAALAAALADSPALAAAAEAIAPEAATGRARRRRKAHDQQGKLPLA